MISASDQTKQSSTEIIDVHTFFLQKENIRPFALEKDDLLQALLLCRSSGRVSFADALVWAAARSTETKIVYSLDERFPRDGVEVRMEAKPNASRNFAISREIEPKGRQIFL